MFVRNNEYKKNKTRFDIANDSSFYFSKSRMVREYDSNYLRLSQDIKFVDIHKTFGLIFVKTLDWLVHINYAKANVSKTVNIMKCVSNVRWEVDQYSLLSIHKIFENSDFLLGLIQYKTHSIISIRMKSAPKLGQTYFLYSFLLKKNRVNVPVVGQVTNSRPPL
jgi:hypothetical protein